MTFDDPKKRSRLPKIDEPHRERYEARLRRVKSDLRHTEYLLNAAREFYSDPTIEEGSDTAEYHAERAEELADEIEEKESLNIKDHLIDKLREDRSDHKFKAIRLRRAARRLRCHYHQSAVLAELKDMLHSDRKRLKKYLDVNDG